MSEIKRLVYRLWEERGWSPEQDEAQEVIPELIAIIWSNLKRYAEVELKDEAATPEEREDEDFGMESYKAWENLSHDAAYSLPALLQHIESLQSSLAEAREEIEQWRTLGGDPQSEHRIAHCPLCCGCGAMHSDCCLGDENKQLRAALREQEPSRKLYKLVTILASEENYKEVRFNYMPLGGKPCVLQSGYLLQEGVEDWVEGDDWDDAIDAAYAKAFREEASDE